MPSIRRLTQQGSAVALTSFLAVASWRVGAAPPDAQEVAKRFSQRRAVGPADVRQRLRDIRGVLRESSGARPPAGSLPAGTAPRWRDGTPGDGPGAGPAGFHAGTTGAPELTPLNPLFDPLQIFGDEAGEEPPVAGLARLFLADFDGDGDLDAFVGDKYGYVRYLENVGSDIDPVYEERTGIDSPTGALDLSLNGDGGEPFGPSAPTLVDIDDDGDLDLFVGQGEYTEGDNGRVLFFQNDGGTLTRNDAGNPLGDPTDPMSGNVFGEAWATPNFVDIDGDEDFDVFIGTKMGDDGGEVFFLENQGNVDMPDFVDQTDVPGSDPFAGVELGGVTAPFFADIDGDDLPDAFVGEYYQVRFFANQGTYDAPVLVEQTGYANPLFGKPCLFPAPSLGDVDGDGDLDAFVTGGYFKLGGGHSSVQYFENGGDVGDPAFLSAGDRIELVDVDGDGDLDALISYLGYDLVDEEPEGFLDVRYFENTGTATEPRWEIRSGLDNPFFTFNTTYAGTGYSYAYTPSVAPTVGDFDRDGVLDAFVGQPNGKLEYLRDDGTGQLLPATHPLDGVDFGSNADPQLIDVNGDGELDLVVGHNEYVSSGPDGGYYVPTVTFFLNETGPGGIDATPDLVVDLSSTGIESPAPTLADIDGDGDMDLYVGGVYGGIPSLYPLTLFLENTAAVPGGLEFDPDSAELVEAFVYPPNSPAVVDVNGDGILDLAIGNLCGVEFFLSEVADLEVTKSVTSGALVPGDSVEYTITLENTGTTIIRDLAGAELTDTLPPELTLTGATVVSGPGAVTFDTGTDTVSYDGTIPPGGVVVITVTADIDDGTEGQTVSNQAFASFDSDGDMTADAMEPSDDPLTAEEDDPTSFVVGFFPVIEVSKAITGGDLEAGGTVEYAVTIRNVGMGPQADDPLDPELTDTLPASLLLQTAMVVSGPGMAVADPGTNTVRYDGTIDAGETVEIVITAMIDPAADGEEVLNQAIAFVDANGDGDNDTEEPSDDPTTPAADDPTRFVVGGEALGVPDIPTLSQWGAMLFGALLSLAGLFGIRRFGG